MRPRTTSIVLIGSAGGLIALLFLASTILPGRAGDLVLGIASSMAAVGMYGAARFIDNMSRERRKVRFFGATLVQEPIFAVPHFLLNEEMLEDSGVDVLDVYLRPTAEQRLPLLPHGSGIKFGIGNLQTLAVADVTAALRLAALFPYAERPARAILDTDITRGSFELGAIDRRTGCIALGLSTNDITLAYLNSNAALFTLERNDDGTLRLCVNDAARFYNDEKRLFGIVVRFRLAMDDGQRATFLVCGGLGPEATGAVAQYVSTNWALLARRAKDADFAAVISQATAGGPPRLELFTTGG